MQTPPAPTPPEVSKVPSAAPEVKPLPQPRRGRMLMPTSGKSGFNVNAPPQSSDSNPSQQIRPVPKKMLRPTSGKMGHELLTPPPPNKNN